MHGQKSWQKILKKAREIVGQREFSLEKESITGNSNRR
jgi:hypothetical protein